MRYLSVVLGSAACLFLSSASADNLLRPPPLIPPRPISRPGLVPRPIPMKPEFKNVLLRGLARSTNYSAAAFLTHPDLLDNFDPSELSPSAQRFFAVFRAELLAQGENFRPAPLVDFVKSLAADSAQVDIEALAYTVLMEAAKAADSDLKAILEAMKKTNESRKALREKSALLDRLAADCRAPGSRCTGGLTKTDLEREIAAARSQLDSLSEMGELESLRLQAAMDRQSKLMSTLSNVLKKISDTSQAITQNIK